MVAEWEWGVSQLKVITLENLEVFRREIEKKMQSMAVAIQNDNVVGIAYVSAIDGSVGSEKCGFAVYE